MDDRPRRLPWDAICQAFPNEFVILGDVEVRDEVSLEVMGGVVLAHGTSRKEALERAGLRAGERWAIEHTSRVRRLA